MAPVRHKICVSYTVDAKIHLHNLILYTQLWPEAAVAYSEK